MYTYTDIKTFGGKSCGNVLLLDLRNFFYCKIRNSLMLFRLFVSQLSVCKYNVHSSELEDESTNMKQLKEVKSVRILMILKLWFNNRAFLKARYLSFQCCALQNAKLLSLKYLNTLPSPHYSKFKFPRDTEVAHHWFLLRYFIRSKILSNSDLSFNSFTSGKLSGYYSFHVKFSFRFHFSRFSFFPPFHEMFP